MEKISHNKFVSVKFEVSEYQDLRPCYNAKLGFKFSPSVSGLGIELEAQVCW